MTYRENASPLVERAEQLSSAFAKEPATVSERIQTLKDHGFSVMAIPTQQGGLGATWPEILAVIREIAAGDSAAGTLLGYHTFNVAHLRMAPASRARFEQQVAEQRWWLSGIANPLDSDMRFRRESDGWRIDGFKTFCTGSAVADRLKVSGVAEDGQTRLTALVPRTRDGVRYGDDWDHLGLNDTYSGSIRFTNVQVLENEQVVQGASDFPWHGLVTPLNQSVFTHLYLGYALGALRAAKAYTRTQSRAWVHSGVAHAYDDDLIVQQYGEFWLNLHAAIALADRAAHAVQRLLDSPKELTGFLDARGEAVVLVAAARVQASRVALELTSKIYEVMGARATANRFGFDRFWRDARTMTLHDPVAYKVLEVGNYALNDRYPEIKSYT